MASTAKPCLEAALAALALFAAHHQLLDSLGSYCDTMLGDGQAGIQTGCQLILSFVNIRFPSFSSSVFCWDKHQMLS